MLMKDKERNMNKKHYETPVLTISLFENEEVLAASGVFNDEGFIELPFIPVKPD